MLTVATTGICTVLFFQAPAKMEPPPAPDFKTRVDYVAWLQKQITGGLPADQNAAPLYKEIFGDAKQTKDAAADLGFDGFRTGDDKSAKTAPWDPAEHRDWERAHRRMDDILDKYQKAAAKPFAYFGAKYGDEIPAAQRTLIEFLVPELTYFRALAKGASENAGGRRMASWTCRHFSASPKPISEWHANANGARS